MSSLTLIKLLREHEKKILFHVSKYIALTLVELSDNHDKSIIKIFIDYHDKDNGFYYHDNSKFLNTTVNYTKHTGVLV